MARESLKGFIQIGVFIALGGGCSALAAPRDSGEFVVSICSTAVGLLILLGSVAAFRLLR